MLRALPVKNETYQNVGLKIPHPFCLEGQARRRRQTEKQIRAPPLHAGSSLMKYLLLILKHPVGLYIYLLQGL